MAPVSSTMKVYVDDHKPTKYKRENVEGWHKASVRLGVVDRNGTETDEFISWKKGCIGRIVIQPEDIDENGNYTKIPRWYAYLETREDLVSYLLTFDEPLPRSEWTTDVAAFYCPYVPLTVVGCTPKNKNKI